ncbi:MAG: PfkB family carbohydrate kinase [Anaerolineae bacterium]|nr:PfkB family carbohydrate kinase [Anaerolineae bacterium]
MSPPVSSVELDYLVIGHMTRDLIQGGGFTAGGTVSYAACTARALGCRVGVITSTGPELDPTQVLDGVYVTSSPAAATTTFENIYSSEGRRQLLHSVAHPLTPELLPSHWSVSQTQGVVHIGPVARECAASFVHAFGDAFIGVTPQGWMRQWDSTGYVRPSQWEGSEVVLARADAVVLSEEDVQGDHRTIAHLAAQTRLLVVTRGAAGCSLYLNGRVHHFPALPVREVDPTGAGDVFAAAFFVTLRRHGDPYMAARFANCIAAHSVTRAGLESIPTPDEVIYCQHLVKGAGG